MFWDSPSIVNNTRGKMSIPLSSGSLIYGTGFTVSITHRLDFSGDRSLELKDRCDHQV